jgi:hypothetical protein
MAPPDTIQQALDAQLEADESVLWVGEPDQRFYDKTKSNMNSNLYFTVPVTVGLSAIFLIADDVHWAAYLAVAVLVFGLLSAIFGRFKSFALYYAVTDKRALIFEGGPSVRITSYYPPYIVGFSCETHEDGYGDVVLRREPYRDGFGDVQTSKFGFFGIKDPQRVEALVRPLALSPEEKRERPVPTCNFPVTIADWKKGDRSDAPQSVWRPKTN